MSISNKTLLYPTETVYRRPPRNLNHKENYLFSNEYTCVLDDCYVYQYENTIVTSRGLAVHYDRNASPSIQSNIHNSINNRVPHIIPQCIAEGKVSMKIIIKSILQHTNSKHSDEIEKGILFTDTNSHGFFHWFADALPRLLSCEHISTDDYTIIIPEKFYTPFARESMKCLGIDERQIHLIADGTMVRVKSLWVMDHPATPVGTGNYRPLLMHKLKTIMESKLVLEEGERETIEKKFGKKIYISRKDAKHRHLINEQEIESIMQENEFTIIHASTLSLREQMILFSGAEVLVSLHGAGLSNMIWMPPHSKVAEIRLQNDAHNNCYFSLACTLDIAYYYSLASSQDEEIHKADLLWDKASALQLLKNIYE